MVCGSGLEDISNLRSSVYVQRRQCLIAASKSPTDAGRKFSPDIATSSDGKVPMQVGGGGSGGRLYGQSQRAQKSVSEGKMSVEA